jgi:hypothetical protein
MDAVVSTTGMEQNAPTDKRVNRFLESFKAVSANIQKLQDLPEAFVERKPLAVKQTRRRTLMHIVLSMLGSAVVCLLGFAIVYCMILYVEHSVQYTEAATSPRMYEVVSVPTIVQQLKRLPKVVEPMPEHVPVDVKLLMKPKLSIFDRTAMRVQVTQKLPVHAVASGPFQGTLPLSAALVPVTNHVDSTVTTHVPVPVETYTQWMLFMQSMSVVKPVEKTKPIAPPTACVCPRDDAKHGNDTSSDVAVESTGAILFEGLRNGMAMVGCAFVVVVGTTFVGVLMAGSGVATE